jgi:hypothetical protein
MSVLYTSKKIQGVIALLLTTQKIQENKNKLHGKRETSNMNTFIQKKKKPI